MYFPKNEDYTFSEKVLTPNLNQETVLRGLKSKLEGISSSSWLESDVLWINGFGCEVISFNYFNLYYFLKPDNKQFFFFVYLLSKSRSLVSARKSACRISPIFFQAYLK